MIQIATSERPSKRSASRHTSMKVSVTMSSAAVASPMRRVTKRKTDTWLAIVKGPHGVVVASRDCRHQSFVVRRATWRGLGGGLEVH
jgi:hypothetical protein